MELTRRDFLKGSAASAVAAAGVLNGMPVLAEEEAEKKYSFETAPDPIPEESIVDETEADVIVVGAGTSGLVTALSALEGGLSVVLFSASSAPCCRGGSNNAYYSKAMEALGLQKYDIGDFERLHIRAASGKTNQVLKNRFYTRSEEAMNWLIDEMEPAGIKATVEVSAGYEYPDPMWDPPTSHSFYMDDAEKDGSVGSGQHYVVEELARLIEEKGGSVIYNMKGEQLIREDNNTGRVSAVVASDADGAYHKFTGTKAIVLAAGDFTLDKEMVEKYCPQVLPFCKDNALDYSIGKTSGGIYPGDMHKAALWIGAAWQKTYPVTCMMGSQFPANYPYACHWGLVVNQNGERFMNEDVLGSIATAQLTRQPGYTGYCIWDTAYAEALAPWPKDKCEVGMTMSAEEAIALWDNKYIVCDTLEELVAELGLPESTLDTIARYNEMCENGYDEDFHKSPAKLQPIKTGPFYGGSKGVSLYTSLGGLRTNNDLQVCDEDDNPIEGLFVVGSMIGDFYQNWYDYSLEGENLGACCVTLPYVLGQDLASGKFDA